jgi:hypothetical protein
MKNSAFERPEVSAAKGVDWKAYHEQRFAPPPAPEHPEEEAEPQP